MSLQLRRIGGISKDKHAEDVGGKVAEILNYRDCVEVVGGSATLSALPALGLPSAGRSNFLPSAGRTENSTKVNKLWQIPWTASYYVILVYTHTLITWNLGASDNGKVPLTSQEVNFGE